MSINIENGYGNTAAYGEGNYKGEIGITYIADHVARARNLIVEQFEDSEKFHGMIAAFSRQIQEIEDVIFDLRLKRYLSIAEGAQLDGIGDIVGELRAGRNDDDYRLAINFRIFINRSYGQMQVLSSFLSQSLEDGTPYVIEESFPAAVDVVIQAVDIQQLPDGIFEKLDDLAAGGVLVNGFIQDVSGNGRVLRTVEVKDDGSGDLAVPLRPDTGSLIEGIEGSYPPSEVTAGKLVEHVLR
jgi:hypothetical protein